MLINDLIEQNGLTKYRLAKLSGVPNATLSELCSGKTHIGKCSAETIYKIAKVLGVSMETLVENGGDSERERSYEYGLPEYLQHDLDTYKSAIKNGSSLLDCLWGELHGSINDAEITDGAITPAHADHLRRKYLYGSI